MITSRMTITVQVALAAQTALTASTVASCGGGSSALSVDAAPAVPDMASTIASPGKLATNVAGDKPLATLSPQDAEKVCMATQEFARNLLMQDRVNDLGCRVAGVIALAVAPDPMAAMACMQAYTTCKAAPPPPAMPMGMTMCGRVDDKCTATVAEYEACVNELPSDLEIIDRLVPPCARATKLSAVVLLGVPSLLGPACQTLEKKCPGTFGGLTTPLGVPGMRP